MPKGRVKIDWNSRAVINAITEMSEAMEHETAKRVYRDVLKKVPVLKRTKKHKYGLYFRAKRHKYTKGRKEWQAMKIPGALKRSVKLHKSRYKDGGYIIWAGDWLAWYARIVEYGTKPRRQRYGGRFTGKMPSKKFLRGPLNNAKRRFVYALQKRLS